MKAKNSSRRRRSLCIPRTVPVRTLSAAKSVVVPWRLYSWLTPRTALPSGQAKVTLGTFERLDMRFLIDGQDDGILGWVQIEGHDLRR